MAQLIEEARTRSIIGAFYEVYNNLGFGFFESIYVSSLERELRARGHEVGREVQVRVYYKGEEVGLHRLDVLVDQTIVVEVKSTAELQKAARRQVYNYLRATDLHVGLLLHFGLEAQFLRVVRWPPGHCAASGESASSA